MPPSSATYDEVPPKQQQRQQRWLSVCAIVVSVVYCASNRARAAPTQQAPGVPEPTQGPTCVPKSPAGTDAAVWSQRVFPAQFTPCRQRRLLVSGVTQPAWSWSRWVWISKPTTTWTTRRRLN
ncbi:hypothetical protein DQ04_02271050 [Trypanosoma grayi]|uniref:hypothetical protein n=1 Tax=Trypanosoma grayi TaxID=71804 RepID=UPI0004F4AD35|nr:hypothetical protein DQ04_02271050 [Trypanosoma grayi]KEG11795.1 hypothetical protein DQ04_02271050 [Trypanosoma grayi]